ncbi:MAG TPA: hypothetical protein DDZ51_03820 [Planctomycetaceae bacterium]|nr:hypothetical protein [Planctomycetaceae bacterium]
MNRRYWKTLSLGFLILALISPTDLVHAQDAVEQDLAAIRNVKPAGAGHVEAKAAAGRLAKLPSSQVAVVLDSMTDASPLAENWLRVIAGSVADNGPFPKEQLTEYLKDRKRDSNARFLAFQILTVRDPESLPTLIEGAQTDPSLPLRHLAISRLINRAEAEVESKNNDAATQTYKLVLAEARNADQLKSAAKSLEKLGEKVDLAKQLAMIRDWWILATYDNKDTQHFNTEYLPESTYIAAGKLPASWLKPGAAIRRGEVAEDTPAGQVATRVTSDDELGMVNLNPPLENAKDSIAYAYAEFTYSPAGASGKTIPAEARLGCINANKIWINGKLVTANEVYHSGTRIDQYVAGCELKDGVNTVLIKVCQNAQTESWAQDWQFQFRFTDRNGAALPVVLTTP